MADTQARAEAPVRSRLPGGPPNGVAEGPAPVGADDTLQSRAPTTNASAPASSPPGTAPGAPAGAPGASGAAPGAAGAAPGTAAPTKPASRRRWLIIGALLAIGLIAGGLSAVRWWLDSSRYVNTNNAQVAGRLVQVGSVAAGRVAAVRYDIGERVRRNDVVAALHVPVPVVTSTGATRNEYRQTNDTLVEVFSPVDGVVIARGASPNDTIPAGQSIVTLVDPSQLWVNANVEETQIRRVRLGQRVIVHLDALDIDLEGRVVAITPASAATFSLVPSQNLSGNFTHVTQLVPVRIALTDPDPRMMIGTSATVRIEVGE